MFATELLQYSELMNVKSYFYVPPNTRPVERTLTIMLLSAVYIMYSWWRFKGYHMSSMIYLCMHEQMQILNELAVQDQINHWTSATAVLYACHFSFSIFWVTFLNRKDHFTMAIAWNIFPFHACTSYIAMAQDLGNAGETNDGIT